MSTALSRAERDTPVPGPLGGSIERIKELRADPLAFFSHMRAQYGPLARLPMGPVTVHLASDPAMVQDVLVTSARSFAKGVGGPLARGGARQPLARLLGDGLLTSSGEFHRSQRRLLQPTFHRDRIAGYGTTFAELSGRAAAGYTDGERLDVHAAMTELTLAIVTKTLFDAELDSEVTAVVRRSMRGSALEPSGRQTFLPGVAQRLPTAANRRARAVRDDLRGVVEGLVTARRTAVAAGTPVGDDLLSMLVTAVDADTGVGMPDHQVRDEALTMLLAGHETTANALSWTFHLLGRTPDAEAALHAELDDVLGDGRLPTVADLPRLRYTDQAFTEAMRMYPPAWMMVRHTVEDHVLGGYPLPTGTTVLMSPWVVHHDPALWPDPYRYDPSRWAPGGPAVAAGRPRFAYFPFGGGARQCIGNSFAQLEGVLALATLASRWRFRPAGEVGTLPMVTLRPAGPMWMVAERRAARQW